MERWACAVIVLATLAAVALAPPLPPAPVLQSADESLARLETAVGTHPEDRAALRDLANAYLDRSEPGLAHAALRRASSDVEQDPALADLQARTLLELGRARDAYDYERTALAQCVEVGCSRTLEARARQRARLLHELLELGIDDPALDHERTLLAYRRSVREVRLAAR